MRPLRLAVSFGLFGVGFFLMAGDRFGVTGAYVGAAASSAASLFGVVTSLVAGMVFAAGLESKIRIKSSLKNHPGLVRLAEDSTKNEKVQSDMNHLIHELSHGNFQAGLGKPGYVKGTSVLYLRGRSGARLFYKQNNKHTFEIVAKSDKANEDKVLDRIRQLYRK